MFIRDKATVIIVILSVILPWYYGVIVCGDHCTVQYSYSCMAGISRVRCWNARQMATVPVILLSLISHTICDETLTHITYHCNGMDKELILYIFTLPTMPTVAVCNSVAYHNYYYTFMWSTIVYQKRAAKKIRHILSWMQG